WEVEHLTQEDIVAARDSRKDARQDGLRAERREKLLDAFREAGARGETLKNACLIARLNAGRMKKEIEEFADDLEPCEVFKNGRVYPGYRIRHEMDGDEATFIAFESGAT